MTAKIHLPTKMLYEEDFNLWLSATAEQLKAGRLDEVDLENLLEEIESMGRSEKNALRSFLKILLEHLLKVAYWESERDDNLAHWLGEIFNFRDEIQEGLNTSPSLKNYLQEIFDSTYPKVAKKVTTQFKFKVPGECPFTLEQVLDPNWFPINLSED